MWCVPTLNAEFKRRMKRVLKLYACPPSELFPVVCVDEKTVELHAEKYPIERRRDGVRRDHEYVRKGTANIFVATAAKEGLHYARVTKRRTKRDFAKFLKWLAARFPSALRINLVMDNLNTHNESSLIEAFGEREGRRLWRRFWVHYTPKHASWLNQAEIAISLMTRSCLGRRRVPTMAELRSIVTAFWRERRRERWTIDWRFTTTRARRWLKSFGTRH